MALAIVACVLHAYGHPAMAQGLGRPQFDGKLTPCRVSGVESELLCGRYEVYENRIERTGRKVSLKIIVLPTTGATAAADAMVYLAGGGVLPATEYAPFFAREFRRLREQRDILLVDQRGTGESNPLPCALPSPMAQGAVSSEAGSLDAIRRCRVELESRADLRYYSTSIAMDDLDDVREWLGYAQLSLYGMSYGTKAAQVYLKQHPSRVRAVAMHGVVPLRTAMWSETPRLGQEALDRVFALCAAQAECHAAFPRLTSEFAALLSRVSANPVRAPVARADGQTVHVTVGGAAVREFVYAAMASSAGIRSLPRVIHLAYREDYRPLAQRLIPGGGGVPRGVFLSIACAEAVALVDTTTIARVTANTFMGDAGVRRLVRSCEAWPRGALPADFWIPVSSQVPALLLSGELDHTTPPLYAQSVARTFGSARHVTLPHRSHNDLDECVARIIESFLISGSTSDADLGCATSDRGLRFITNP